MSFSKSVALSFTDCAKELGFSYIPDTNIPTAPPDGIATLYCTVNSKKQRVSTFHAFLPKEIALQRKNNLTICTSTLTCRVGFSQKDEKPRANEVFFKSVDPKSEKIFSASTLR